MLNNLGSLNLTPFPIFTSMSDTSQRISATSTSSSRKMGNKNTAYDSKSVGNSLGIAANQNHGGLFNKGSKVTFNDGTVIDVDRKSLANVIMQERSNALNYAIANEANALNYRMFNEQNEYNSTKSQKQRILDAGMNPTSLLAGQGVEGSASWQPSANPTMQTADASGYDPMQGMANFSHLASNVASVASSSNSVLSAAKQAIDLGTHAAKNAADLEQVKANTHSTDVKTAIDDIQKDVLGQSKDALVAKNQADANLSQEQAKYTAAQAAYQQLQNMAFPERNKVEIAELAQRVALMKEQGLTQQTQRKLFKAQAEKILKDKEYVDKVLEWFDANQIANLGLVSANTAAANASAAKSYADVKTADTVQSLNKSIKSQVDYNTQHVLPAQVRESKSRKVSNYVHSATDVVNTGLNGFKTFQGFALDALKALLPFAK